MRSVPRAGRARSRTRSISVHRGSGPTSIPAPGRNEPASAIPDARTGSRRSRIEVLDEPGPALVAAAASICHAASRSPFEVVAVRVRGLDLDPQQFAPQIATDQVADPGMATAMSTGGAVNADPANETAQPRTRRGSAARRSPGSLGPSAEGIRAHVGPLDSRPGYSPSAARAHQPRQHHLGAGAHHQPVSLEVHDQALQGGVVVGPDPGDRVRVAGDAPRLDHLGVARAASSPPRRASFPAGRRARPAPPCSSPSPRGRSPP